MLFSLQMQFFWPTHPPQIFQFQLSFDRVLQTQNQTLPTAPSLQDLVKVFTRRLQYSLRIVLSIVLITDIFYFKIKYTPEKKTQCQIQPLLDLLFPPNVIF